MKVLILAGGTGTRLSEETDVIPKPLLGIGGNPILWHIMKGYSAFGLAEFVILLGYKGYLIRDYFANYYLHHSDVTVDLSANTLSYHNNRAEPWKVSLIDTGLNSMTGGRIKRAKEYIKDETFMLTYGDGVADINFNEFLAFHQKHGHALTMTSVQPGGSFGSRAIDESKRVRTVRERPKVGTNWINGGFFVCEPKVLDYLSADDTVFEHGPLEKLAQEGELYTYMHAGFWQCMDTLRDKKRLNELWDSGQAKWKVW